MQIIEASVSRRTLAHKPLSEVSVADIVAAYVDVDDLRDVLQGQWDQINWGEDVNGEPFEPPLPRSSEQLTDDQLVKVTDLFSKLIPHARSSLAKIATLPVIPITRRLRTIADLSRPLGVHWSYGHEANRSTVGARGEHILYAEVDNHNVDWTTTLARAIFWWAEEQEITPVATSPLRLMRIEFATGTSLKA